jgi:choline kinase
MTARAIILAAGRGTRLSPLTDERPKCLVELAGKSLLERQLAVLSATGLTDITVVGGYRSDTLEGRDFDLLRNPRYDSTNMVNTLFCARQVMGDDVDLVVSYGDIVFERRVLEALLGCAEPVAVTVDRSWRRYWSLRMGDPLADAETLKLAADGRILELGKKPKGYDDIQGQYMGLMKFRADHVVPLQQVHRELDPSAEYDGKDKDNMYMTSFLQHLIDIGWRVQSVPVDGGWLETDTVEDLELYHRLEAEGRLGDLYRLAS